MEVVAMAMAEVAAGGAAAGVGWQWFSTIVPVSQAGKLIETTSVLNCRVVVVEELSSL